MCQLSPEEGDQTCLNKNKKHKPIAKKKGKKADFEMEPKMRKGPARRRRLTEASVVLFLSYLPVLILVIPMPLWCRLPKPVFWYFVPVGITWYFNVWLLPSFYGSLDLCFFVWFLVVLFHFCHSNGMKRMFLFSTLIEQQTMINDDK
jgi:hypothetical protein